MRINIHYKYIKFVYKFAMKNRVLHFFFIEKLFHQRFHENIHLKFVYNLMRRSYFISFSIENVNGVKIFFIWSTSRKKRQDWGGKEGGEENRGT